MRFYVMKKWLNKLTNKEDNLETYLAILGCITATLGVFLVVLAIIIMIKFIIEIPKNGE